MDKMNNELELKEEGRAVYPSTTKIGYKTERVNSISSYVQAFVKVESYEWLKLGTPTSLESANNLCQSHHNAILKACEEARKEGYKLGKTDGFEEAMSLKKQMKINGVPIHDL